MKNVNVLFACVGVHEWRTCVYGYDVTSHHRKIITVKIVC